MPYELILWDWNGTLLDDVAWCIRVVNTMLEKRGLAPLAGVADYHRVFRFPVIEYYRSVGFDFDKEPFEALAEEYMALYHAGDATNCGLHEEAEATLRAVQGRGVRQVILSASQVDNLNTQLSRFDIAWYFDDVLGISDIYAKSKVEAGQAYIRREKPGRVLMVGDTTHDHEVALALGADCLLVAKGHQSAEALAGCGVPVLGDAAQVLEHLG